MSTDHDPAAIEAYRTLREAQHEAHIQAIVDQAPPLTDAQRVRLRALLAPEGRDHAPAIETPKDVIQGQGGPEVVYFMRNGDRIKIGTSRNLAQRVRTLSLRDENVLLAVHGNHARERRFHARFHDQRVGLTEWFDLAGDLSAYLGNMADGDGPDHHSIVYINVAALRRAAEQAQCWTDGYL
jgi:hypothetical protein